MVGRVVLVLAAFALVVSVHGATTGHTDARRGRTQKRASAAVIADLKGTIVAFVFRSHGQPTGEGVKVVVAGSKASISRRRDEIVAMIRSIRTAT